MVIVGFDPGLRNVGWGVVRVSDGRVLHVAHGMLELPRSGPLPAALRAIHEGVLDVVANYGPHRAIAERVLFGTGRKTMIALAHARGALLTALALNGLHCEDCTPNQVKKAAAGRGDASKDQVMAGVAARLRMTSPPATEHAADGLGACLHMIDAQRLA